MKHLQKLATLLLAVLMVFALTTTAMAASITINGVGSEYAAYRLLNATNAGDLYAYTLNEKYTAILQAETGKTEQAGIVDYIQSLNNEAIRSFADDVYAAIKAEGLAADYTTTDKTFTGIDQGYYLIAETKLDGTADTYSLVMVDTAGDADVTVNTKESLPTVEKKVEEINDSNDGAATWGDAADYDIGDTINYQITGTVSNQYANYASYYYSFSDTMGEGLTLNATSIKITIDGIDVTERFDIDTTEHSFTATANLKELSGVTVTADSEVVVTYTATLNENAVAGTEGNSNTVVLEYENDPYHKADGDPETPDEPVTPSVTPEDKTVVFTYDLSVDKIDANGKALEGAGFTLYKYDADAEGDDKYVAVGTEITGVTTFAWEGLDEGKYKLVETTVPDGYNKADDIEFEVVSTLEGTALTDLTVTPAESFTVTVSSGLIETDILNTSGTELPSTGGIGTTIFYIVGGLLVAGAVVLLVTKRRLGKMEE